MNKVIRFFKRQKYILSWFWKDAILPHQTDILKINILDLCAVASEVAAYGVIVLFVKALQTNEPVKIQQLHLELDVSANRLLWYATISATFFFLANAFFRYFSKKATFLLAKRYDKFCSLRLLMALRGQNGPGPGNYSYAVKKAIIKDSRVCGSMLKAAASFIIPLLKIIGSVAFMLYTNIWITLLVICLFPVALYFLQRLGSKTVRETQVKEKLLPLFIKQVVEKLQAHPESIPPELNRRQTRFHHSDIDAYYDAHYNTRIYANQNLLIIKLSIAGMTFLILMIVGNFILLTQIQWNVLITFAIAMQFFFRSLQGLAGITTQISGKIDYVRQYHSILHGVLNTPQDAAPALADDKLAYQIEEEGADDLDDFDDL